MKGAVIGTAHRTPALGGADFFSKLFRQNNELCAGHECASIERQKAPPASVVACGKRRCHKVFFSRISSIVPLLRTVKTTSNQLPISGSCSILISKSSPNKSRVSCTTSGKCSPSPRRATSAKTPAGTGVAVTRAKVSSDLDEMLMKRLFNSRLRCHPELCRTPPLSLSPRIQARRNTLEFRKPTDGGRVRFSAPSRRCTGPRGPLCAGRRRGRWTSRAGARSARANRRCPANWPGRRSVASRIPSRD